MSRSRRAVSTFLSIAVAAAGAAALVRAEPSSAPTVAESIRPPRPVVSPRGMVVTATPEATGAAVRVLEAGGNAVDAAVAAAFALGASDPGGSGLGGQTWIVLRLASGVERAIQCPSRVPMQIDRDRIRQARRGPDLWGPMAATVPTSVATLDHALRKYGRLPLAEVLRPAVEAAESGYALHDYEYPYLQDYRHRLFDSEVLLPVYLTEPVGESGYPEPTRPGQCVRLPGLAATLRRLAQAGARDFYSGELAATLASEVRAAGGFISRADLLRVPASVRDVAPVRGEFRGGTALSVPSPAGGGVLAMTLQILDALPPESLGRPGLPRGYAIVEAVRLARAQWALRQASEEVTEGPFVSEWLTPRWAAGQAARIHPGKAIPREELLAGAAELPREGGTTHVSVVDAEGNAVSLTQSLGRYFGAAWSAPSLGFPLNSFAEPLLCDERLSAAYAGPGATAPVPSAPLVFVRDGRAVLVAGTGGSSRIPSILANLLVALFDGGDTTAEAYARPRFLWEDDSAGPRVMIEIAPPFVPSDVDAIKAAGYARVFALSAPDRNTPVFGGIHAVVRNDADGTWEGWFDGRRVASAAAPERTAPAPR